MYKYTDLQMLGAIIGALILGACLQALFFDSPTQSTTCLEGQWQTLHKDTSTALTKTNALLDKCIKSLEKTIGG